MGFIDAKGATQIIYKPIDHDKGGKVVAKHTEKLITDLTNQMSEAEKKVMEAYWQAATAGEKKAEENNSHALKEWKAIVSDPKIYQQLQDCKKEGVSNPILARQVELLLLEFMENQASKEEIAEILRLETEIKSTFVHFRANDQGKKVTNNELTAMLKSEKDTYRRKEIWKASKEIGRLVADNIRELVRRRNEVARKQGLRDYYAMSLTLQELNEEKLFQLLAELKEQTDQPYTEIKKEMDQVIAARYLYLRPEGVRPWHYEDPFFQEAPMVFDVNIDEVFADHKLEELAERTFQEMGFAVQGILDQSDLYERDRKSPYAFCIDIDRKGDTRILCNLQSNAYWMNTLLHELGHGVYQINVNPELPFLLRKATHPSSTEAIALMMEQLGKSPTWLSHIVGVETSALEKMTEPLAKQMKLSQLISVRWCLVMIHFERELYLDPDQDLNRLWWDLVEQFQFVPRPEGRDEPDWAAKVHLGAFPVYYQNYLLGELTASQLLATVSKEFPKKDHPLVENEAVGGFLKDRFFREGARYRWDELIEQATGEKLNPEYFVSQFVENVSNDEEKQVASKK
ncbi:M2 family metallopeptidase [Marininema halotolerans]|uniref:Peptidyl-dipeptidase A n=1 Tax=Marininema halotolerans TaxID=1155944 RepID=A0A1I6UAW9_9BACL|nr:M2 family metallopeptidase [Marininema halotolerans]SFS98544.1 peptidyl-dipeptidase A [Marininema halotolerans]